MNGLQIYTDGAARGNPGHAAWAYLILDGMAVISKRSGYIGVATNNIAEYTAILEALAEAKRYAKPIWVYSDSELAINQINGRYKINLPHLQKLCSKVKKMRPEFSRANFIHVGRDNRFIRMADRLSNRCLDKHRLQGGKN